MRDNYQKFKGGILILKIFSAAMKNGTSK